MLHLKTMFIEGEEEYEENGEEEEEEKSLDYSVNEYNALSSLVI